MQLGRLDHDDVGREARARAKAQAQAWCVKIHEVCERVRAQCVCRVPGANISVQGIFATCAIPKGSENASLLCPVISRFNHSCAWNAVYDWRPSIGR